VSLRRMHAGEVEVDVSLVRRLLAAQFPEWAHLPLERVDHAGTDNAIYRLGEDMSVRLPRIHWATGQAEKEQRWLPRLAPHLPLAVPIPLAIGMPGEGYPWRWSVSPWLEGEEATGDRIADLRQAATDLARFLAALQRIDPTGGPLAAEHNLRGAPLAMRDSVTREAIAALDGVIDTGAATTAWEAALQAPQWDRASVWFHGDVLAGNLLVDRGRLSAAIDFGGLGVGDPACDLMSAWSLFSGDSREVFRSATAVDDATWARARGCALSQALLALPYYLETNPVIVARSRHAIEEILADHASEP
jgi:aminoglycoside phosphotransferase (APT) family kinase protein